MPGILNSDINTRVPGVQDGAFLAAVTVSRWGEVLPLERVKLPELSPAQRLSMARHGQLGRLEEHITRAVRFGHTVMLFSGDTDAAASPANITAEIFQHRRVPEVDPQDVYAQLGRAFEDWDVPWMDAPEEDRVISISCTAPAEDTKGLTPSEQAQAQLDAQLAHEYALETD